VIKPCSGGSSVGVSLVDGEEDLKAALETAFKCDSPFVIDCVIDRDELVLPILPQNKTAQDIITKVDD